MTDSRVHRHFQRYTPEQRADHAASGRLGYRQRDSFGEFFWTHDSVPGIAFPTRKAAVEAGASAEQNG